MTDASIVLIASEHSVSNLLRKLLSNHSRISGPVAPHLLAEFAPLARLYGDLSNADNVRTLHSNMLRSG